MTGRERVLAALNFKATGIVPFDFGGHRSSSINVSAYKALRHEMGLPESPLYVYDFIQQTVFPDEDILSLVGADVLQLGYYHVYNENYWKDWVLRDGTKCKIPKMIDVRKNSDGMEHIYNKNGRPMAVRPPSCAFYEQNIIPLSESDTEDFSSLEEILKDVVWANVPCPPMPIDLQTEDGVRKLKDIAGETRKRTEKAIYATFGGKLLELGQMTFGTENFFCDMITNPRRVHKFLDALLAYHKKNLSPFLDAVGEDVDVIGLGDDFGMQNGPQISRDMYLEFFQPREKELCEYIHQRFPRLKICFHSCGDISSLLQDIADAGIDAVNPVQIGCPGMNPQKIKEQMHGRLSFWGGGCDTKYFLPYGTENEIKQHVKQNIKALCDGGGFVFQQVHNIVEGVPPKNILAMFEAVNEYNEACCVR